MTEQTQSLDVQQEHQKFIEDLGDWTRSHTCGQLTLDNDGQTVCLMGWVQYRRDHGGLIFVDLRDREGLTQVVFSPDIAPAAHENAHILRSEYVLAIKGVVRPRPEGMTNPNLVTGAIEVVVHEWKLLNTSKTPPFAIEERCDAGENLRLAWRYLDLRRPRMQANLRLRHKVAQAHPPPAGRRRLPGSGDPGAHQVHARRRPRLPGAQPSQPRPVLRPAAVAPAVQAAAHGGRFRPLLPDRALLP